MIINYSPCSCIDAPRLAKNGVGRVAKSFPCKSFPCKSFPCKSFPCKSFGREYYISSKTSDPSDQKLHNPSHPWSQPLHPTKPSNASYIEMPIWRSLRHRLHSNGIPYFLEKIIASIKFLSASTRCIQMHRFNTIDINIIQFDIIWKRTKLRLFFFFRRISNH